jgi:hypothetical protein
LQMSALLDPRWLEVFLGVFHLSVRIDIPLLGLISISTFSLLVR